MGWQDRDYNREEPQYGGGGYPPVRFALPRISPLALTLILVCVAIFVCQRFLPLVDLGALSFYRGRAWSQPWRWVTYQYLHGGVMHIAFNCLGIYFFVPPLEQRWGWKRVFLFYTLGGIVAGMSFGLLCAMFGYQPPLIGASGSIFAVMGACGLLMPEFQIVLIFFLVPIRAAVALLGILFLLTAVTEGNLSNAAHLGGLVFGFFMPMTFPRFRKWQIRREAIAAERDLLAERREQQEIDRILEKVHQQGMQSLSGGEKRMLKRATERQRERSRQRERPGRYV